MRANRHRPHAACCLAALLAALSLAAPFPVMADDAEAIANDAEAIVETGAPEIDLSPALMDAPETGRDPAPVRDPEAQRAIDAIGQLYDNGAPPAAQPSPDGEAPADASRDSGFALYLLRVFGSLFLVIALILMLFYLARRLGRQTPLLAGSRYGDLLGRLHLSPHASLHFVRAGGRVLLLGVTQQQVNLVTEFDAADFPGDVESPPLESPDAGGQRNFLAELRQSAEGYEAPRANSDELAALRGDIQRLQEFIKDRGRDDTI